MGLDREVEQPERERVELQREHATDVHRGQPCLEKREEQPSQVRCGGDELVLVGGAQDRVAERERASRLDAHQVGRRENALDPVQLVDHDEVVGARVEHVDDGIDGEPVRPDRHRSGDDARHGALGGNFARDDSRAKSGIREDVEVLAVENEDRRDRVLGHDPRGRTNRDVGTAEHGRTADQLLHAQGGELGKGVHRVAGLGQPFAEGHGDVAGSRRTAEHRECLFARDGVADAAAVGAHRERRRHAGQQGGVAEALTRLEHVHDLLLVDKLGGALADDVEVLGRLAVLDEDVLPVAVRAHLDGLCHGLELVGGQRVEGREAPEEGGHLVCVHRIHSWLIFPVFPL